jgi:TP901 family phage tail tape measure protein
MALEALRELFIKLGLEADEAKFATAEAAVHGLEKALELVVEVAEKVGEVLVETVMGTAEYADKMVDTAIAAGLTTDQLQELEWAAAHSGLSMDDTTMATERLSRAMYDAKKGGEEQAKMFGALGVKVTDAAGNLRPTYDVLLDVADAFKKLPPGAERTAKAMEIFGRSGAKLVPLLVEGREGIEGFAESAHRAGVVMSSEDLAAAKELAEDLDSLKLAAAGASHQVGSGLIKALDPLLKRFNKWFEANRELIGQKLDEYVVKPLTWAIDKLSEAFDLLVKYSDPLLAALKTLAVTFLLLQLQSAGTAIAMVVNAAAAAAAWLAASWPLVLIGALLALVVLAVQDFYTYLNDGESVTGRLIGKLNELSEEWMHSKPGDGWLISALKMATFFLTKLLPESIRWLLDKMSGLANVFGVELPNLPELQKRLPTTGAGMLAAGFSDASTSPQGTAQAQGSSPFVMAPQEFNAGGITINAQPGQSPSEIATATTSAMDRWWNEKASAALPVVR